MIVLRLGGGECYIILSVIKDQSFFSSILNDIYFYNKAVLFMVA